MCEEQEASLKGARLPIYIDNNQYRGARGPTRLPLTFHHVLKTSEFQPHWKHMHDVLQPACAESEHEPRPDNIVGPEWAVSCKVEVKGALPSTLPRPATFSQ